MAAPDPEELYDPTVLTPEEAIEVEAIAQRRPVGVLQVGLALAAAFLVYQRVIQRRLEKTTAPTPELMERALVFALKDTFTSFAPNWVKMVSPLMYAGYLVGVQQSGVTLPKTVLEQMSDGYSESLGNYIHRTSSHAMLSGFRALVNRKVDHRRALLQTTSAFGVGPRAMNALVNVWSAEEPKAYTNVRQISSQKNHRAKLIITKSLKDRAKAIGEHESWNAKEQAKEASWMYALRSGIISGAADKIWLTRENERVCHSCGPLDGMKVPVDAKFETKLGKTMTPPLHVGCGCEIQLKANLRRVLLGQLRKQPVKKAYEGHPWARHQQRDEEGQWVKSSGNAHGQPQPALAPAYEPEEPPPAPPQETPEQPRYAVFNQPYATFSPTSSQGFATFSPPQEAPPPPVEHAVFTPTPPVEHAVFTPPPVEHAVFKPHKTPFSHATYAPSQATPQPVAPRPQERQRFQEEQWKAPKPSIINLDRGEEVYGVVPDDLDHVQDYDLHENRMVNDIRDLHDMVEETLAERYSEHIHDVMENGASTLTPIYSEGGEQYYADYEAVRDLFEWTRAKQLYEDHRASGDPDRMEPSSAFDPMHEIPVKSNYDNRAHQIEAEVLSRKGRLDGIPVEDLIDELTPSVVKVDRIDMELSTEDLGINRRDKPDWIVTGPHHNIEYLHSLSDPDTGERIRAHVYHLDPFDD